MVEVTFIVKIEPKVSWADEIFLGNFILETLSNAGRTLRAFEVKEVKLYKGTAQD